MVVFQFNVFARDTGVPPLTSATPAAVAVTVVRNLNVPLFTQPSYAVAINNSLPVGTQVIDVDALDADSQVNTGQSEMYELKLAGRFFSVDEEGLPLAAPV